jgi:hypothetical protein
MTTLTNFFCNMNYMYFGNSVRNTKMKGIEPDSFIQPIYQRRTSIEYPIPITLLIIIILRCVLL